MNEDTETIIEELKKQIEEARKQDEFDYASFALKIHAFEGVAIEANDIEAFSAFHALLQTVFADWNKQHRRNKNNGDNLSGLLRLKDELDK